MMHPPKFTENPVFRRTPPPQKKTHLTTTKIIFEVTMRAGTK